MRADFKKYLTAICLGGALVATPALAAPHHGDYRSSIREPNSPRPNAARRAVHGGAAQQAPAQTRRTPQFQTQQVQNNRGQRGARTGNNRGRSAQRSGRPSRNSGVNNRGINRSNPAYRGNIGNSSQWRGRANSGNRVTNRSHNRHHFTQRSYSRFSTHERNLWRSGRWHHGRHHGHDGWWWTTGGAWYFYTQPIYPYPGYVSSYYYSAPYYDDPYYGSYLPYAGDVPPADDDSAGGPPPDNDQYWYYCRDPEGYYPYVRECRGRWEPVEPTPYDEDDGR